VPGHEIAGIVTEVGSNVTSFKVGDRAGVGCFVDSCGSCANCVRGEEQYCLDGGNTATYNGRERDGVTPTYGGYSTRIVVKERYVLHIPENLPLDGAAPLLCAGITLFNPLSKWKVGPGMRVGVMGLGGLGHMGVKLAVAMGADVTMISHSAAKEEDARRLGAHHFLLSSDKEAMKAHRYSFDVIANTVSADIDLNPYLSLLGLEGAWADAGGPPSPCGGFDLVWSRDAPQPCAAFPKAASMLGAANDRAAPAFLRMKQRIAAAHAARMELGEVAAHALHIAATVLGI
jgi:uncharacterized zinc-type alcohol dehydrogenase-like protein